MVRLIEENDRKVGNDSFSLNIWWNLNILRDTLRRVRQLINLTLLVSGRTIPILCILALKVLGWRPMIAAVPSFSSMRHRVSERILRIWFRSVSSNVLTAIIILLDRRDLFAQIPGVPFYEGLDHQRDVFFPLP